MALSMSVSAGKHNAHHNVDPEYRSHLKNVDPALTKHNKVIEDEDIRQVYGRLFGASLEKYNEKQMATGKQNRCITDYYQKIFDAWRRDEAKIDGKTKRRSNVAHSCYEYVLQIGNRETWKQLTVEQDEEILEDAARRIQARTAGAIEWFQIAYHVDEKDGTPHIHMAGVPYSTGNRRGLETQVSMGGALKKLRLARLPDLQELMMKELEAAAHERGVERLYMDEHRRHQDVPAYRQAMRDLDAANGKLAAKSAELEELEGKTAEAKKEAAAAKEEAVREAEKTRANAQAEAARTKERAETAAKSTKEAAEAEAGRTRAQAKKEAEKAKEDAAADVQKLREQAEREVQKQRNYAKWLGEEGDGIRWKRSDGSTYDEKSVKQVRADRDAVQAEADAAKKKRDTLLAFADEIQGERYEIDGRIYPGISALADELKGLRADCAVAKNELAAAQDKASRAEAHAAKAEADLKAAEAAKAQAEASLSSLRDSEKEARARAQKWQERSLAHYHEMHLTPDDLLDALLIMARRVADVVCQLWVRARDIAVQEWNIWQTRDMPAAAGDMGIYIGDAFEVSDRAMRETAEAYGRPEIADDLLDMPSQGQELEYDDWER